MKIWWDEQDSDIGWYSFMFDDIEWAYICYIPIKYKNWTEKERKRRFNDGIYQANYCLDGCSKDWVLNSKTLDKAKKELQEYFVDYYKKRIENAKNRIKYCEEILKSLKEQ